MIIPRPYQVLSEEQVTEGREINPVPALNLVVGKMGISTSSP
jgi:hypothetical protein